VYLIKDIKSFIQYHDLKGLSLIKLFFIRYCYVILLIRSQAITGALFFPIRAVSKIFLSMLFNIEVASQCKIGPGLILPHPRNIVLGGAALGSNCTVMANVTIGASLPDPGFNTELRPKICNDVFIGVGAVILGGIEVGESSKIGANAVVTKSVESGRTIVGNNKIL
jgi:serine O-acetyltransferase